MRSTSQPAAKAPVRPPERRERGRVVPRVEREDAPDDAELVLRARRGDRWAQEAIFRRYVHEVTSIVQRLIRRCQDADDIVQETFTSALTSLDALREPEALRSWLLGIAVHRVKRRDRKQSFLRMLGLDQGLDDASLTVLASTDATPEMCAELALVEEALARVPHDERVAWMLRYVEGEKMEDVASILGCSLATAKRRVSAADSRVQQHIGGRS